MKEITLKSDIMWLGGRLVKAGTYTAEQIGDAVIDAAVARKVGVLVVKKAEPVERGNPKKVG